MKLIRGKILWRGMGVSDMLTALRMSGKWNYIANVGNEFWFRHAKFGDVIVVSHSASGIVNDIDIL